MSSIINTSDISASASIGTQAKAIIWIPVLISITLILIVGQITGIFKTKRR